MRRPRDPFPTHHRGLAPASWIDDDRWRKTEAILGMSSAMVRHYGKGARESMIARGAANRIAGGNIILIAGQI
jgi:hypothetical protein